LGLLTRPGIYARLEAKGKRLEEGFARILKKYSIRGTINRVGSMMTLFFGIDHVRNADDARNCDRQRFARYFHGMLRRGIYLPPAAFEAMFVSLAHSTADIDSAVAAFRDWAAEETRR
jgi:glutamate-1-semialdehyde 2,1-aminomutase